MIFKISIAIFVSLFGLIRGRVLAADGAGATITVEKKIPGVTVLSLGDVLRQYREKASLSGLKGALSKKAESQNAIDTKRFPGPLILGVAGDKAVGDRRESKIDIIAKRKIALGIDKETIARRYQAEAKIELVIMQREARERELEIAKLFAQLRLKKETFIINSETLSFLLPLEKQAKAAAQFGTLGGFFATRLKLTVNNISADLAHAQNAFALQAKVITDVTGIEIPLDPLAVNLIPIDVRFEHLKELTEENFLPAAENLARQEGVAAQATQLSKGWEMEAGLGITRNVESKINGIRFEIDVPIRTANAARSQVKSLTDELSLLKAENEYAMARATDRVKVLKANIDRLTDAAKIDAARIGDLEALLSRAQDAFRSGQGDIAEVIETSKELHDSRIKRADLQSELEEAKLTLEFFSKGDFL
jgi:hypothetical protein